MNFLLDTDTCVFWLRGNTPVRDHLASVGQEAVAISVVPLAELRYGASSSAQPDTNHQAIDDFTSAIAILGIDPPVAHAFGNIKAELRNRGMLIEDFDILVAATARAHGLTLVTNNAQHFRRILNLSLESWTQARSF